MGETNKRGSKAGKNEIACSHCRKQVPRIEDLPWTDASGANYCNSCGAFLPRVYQKKINTAH